MLMLPRSGTEPSSYTLRRDWDHMVMHLQGVEPPKNFKMDSGFEVSDQEVLHEQFF